MTTSTPPPGGYLSEASYVDMDVIEQVELPEQVKGELEYHSSAMNPIESEDELTIRGGKPMTNYNERLDERLDDLTRFMESIDWEFDENGYTFDDNYINFRTANILRQNITSLIKELVAEAKPESRELGADEFQLTNAMNNGYNNALSEYHQNLLKALEEN